PGKAASLGTTGKTPLHVALDTADKNGSISALSSPIQGQHTGTGSARPAWGFPRGGEGSILRGKAYALENTVLGRRAAAGGGGGMQTALLRARGRLQRGPALRHGQPQKRGEACPGLPPGHPAGAATALAGQPRPQGPLHLAGR